ncbi:hypothetical protein TrLO_g13491 [Triparma laevis f. longispina]|uniref:START domain-containing protein n=1 Tax=Triparma laevis f. longispina TaxID=1714387 RepID=A0A9W7EJ52_9STRA|nr:hypothetical protein TrLO_g13491 [Triparma laevis f. longispina]
MSDSSTTTPSGSTTGSPTSFNESVSGLSKSQLLELLTAERTDRKKEKTSLEEQLYALQEHLPSKQAEEVGESLDKNTPGVVEFENDMLVFDKVTLSKTTQIPLHEEIDQVYKALTSNFALNTSSSNTLRTELISSTKTSKIVHYSFLIDQSKFCSLILRLNVIKKIDTEIFIEIESCSENNMSRLPTLLWPTSKQYRLILSRSNITLKKIPLLQTEFTFKAEIDLGEVIADSGEAKKTVLSSSKGLSALSASGTSIIDNSGMSKTKVVKLGNRQATLKGLGSNSVKFVGLGLESVNANDLFCKVTSLFYERFKKEEVIDARAEEDFIKNIDNAVGLTEEENTLINESLNKAQELRKVAKRIQGTIGDPVEKFLHRSEQGGAGWGITVVKMDLSAEELFAKLWLCDSYLKKAESSNLALREIWFNLNGTRSLQYSRSVNLPGGFQDRYLELWMTWSVFTDEDGRRTFVLANAPIEDYGGMRHSVPGTEKLQRAISRGVLIAKELTDNTCEFTRCQQVDLKIKVLPVKVLDFVVKSHLGWANQLREEFRRNGRKVDRERVDHLAKIMREKRGHELQRDQTDTFGRCLELLEDRGEAGWKVLDVAADFPDVLMRIKYFPPKNGERSVATGQCSGVAHCSAEEVAAWVMDYCSNERMRINHEDGDVARLVLGGKGTSNESYVATVKSMPFFLDNREFVVRIIWKAEETRILVAVESVDDKVDYGGLSKSTTRGFTRAVWEVYDLPERGGARQCHITLSQKMDAGGSIPTWLVDKKAPVALSAVQEAIDEFRQDEFLDAADIGELATLMKERWEDEVYSEEENAFIQRNLEKFDGALATSSRWKQLHSPNSFINMEMLHEEGQTVAICRATAIFDTTIEDCAASEFRRMTRDRKKLHIEEGGLERSVVNLNNHCDIYQTVYDLSIPTFAPREWVSKCAWKKMSESKLVTAYVDHIDEEAYPVGAGKNYVRASTKALYIYERLPDFMGVPQTKVTYYQQIELRGFIPKFLMNSKMTTTLGFLTQLRKIFDKSEEIDALDREELVQRIKRKGVVRDALAAEVTSQFEEMYVEDVKG